MSSRNNDKNKDVLKELEKKISPVLVINNSSLKPYVELFEYSPENIYQQPLGHLVGFFEIKEYSDDSAYIVNFLTSVLKKEYYTNPRRSVAESLDSALYKVNMALSEIVKHGNIEWLGKLNAAICVLEKNNAHFSVAGSAKIFLYRNKMLHEISQDLASDSPEPHPLKTFVNVSSGRLEKDDRMLITPEDIFHILPTAELKKNFQRFEGDKFVQFLKTALSNQLEMIATIVIEIAETIPVATVNMATPRKKLSSIKNVFSKNTFENIAPSLSEEEKETDEQHEPDEETTSEYTDKKTGHIYVQGEVGEPSENSRLHIYWDISKEKIAQTWYISKNALRRRFSVYKTQRTKKKELLRIEKEKKKQLAAEEKERQRELKAAAEIEKNKALEEAREKERQQKLKDLEERERQRKLEEAEEIDKQRRLDVQKIEQEKDLSQDYISQQEQQPDIMLKIERLYKRSANEEKISAPEQARGLSFREKLQQAIFEEQKNKTIALQQAEELQKNEEEAPSEIKEISILEDEGETWEEPAEKKSKIGLILEFLKKVSEKSIAALKNIFQKNDSGSEKIIESDDFSLHDEIKKESPFIPHFSKIGKLFKSMPYQQKLYALLVLLLILVVPIFINRWLNKPEPQTIPELQTVLPPDPSEKLASEKNINLSPQKQIVLSRNDIVATLVVDSGITVVTKNSVIVVGSDGQQKEFQLPENSEKPIRATFMKDLALVFILTDKNKIVSFSPVSLKFTENNIVLPENPSSLLVGTYLTYLYVLDPGSNQIYRYPRATGGFGEKTNWLKDATSLSQVSDMTIDDNIYCIQNNQILKFFKGKSQSLTLETSNTPVNFDKIFTTIDSQFLYALDAKNSRIVKFKKEDGSIVAQYFNEDLNEGKSIFVDENSNKAYVANSSELFYISL